MIILLDITACLTVICGLITTIVISVNKVKVAKMICKHTELSDDAVMCITDMMKGK